MMRAFAAERGPTERFVYRRSVGVTVLSARMTEFSYKRHAHEEYALGVTLRGLQQYHCGGVLCSSRPGGVMLFSPEQAHDGAAGDREGIDYVMLYVPAPVFAEAAGLRDTLRFSESVIYDRRAASALRAFARAALDGRDEAFCTELLLAAARVVARTGDRSPGLSHGPAVRRAQEMLRHDMGAAPRLDDLCREVGLSKFHFIRLFQRATGVTPYQYFLGCRLERVKELLERGEDAYSAMLDCGFYDLSHLNRHFKAVYGTTPLEYARQLGPRPC
ncbi:helix-turn-helix domain-containing protein [Desulfovibrio sp.]